jgi:hypothetical protein
MNDVWRFAMRMLSGVIAVLSLLGVIAIAPVFGAALFMLLLGGLFLLALTGVLSSVEDRRVPQHDPSMDPTGWRTGR